MGDEYFTPLTTSQCWARACQLVRENSTLYFSIAAAVVVPVKILLIGFFPKSLLQWESYPPPYDTHDVTLLEVAVVVLAGILASGPIAIATAALYLEHSNEARSWDWTDCVALLWQDATYMKTVGASGALAVFATSAASIFFYLPGLWVAASCFFCPYVALWEGRRRDGATRDGWYSSIGQIFRRSHALSKTSRQILLASLVAVFFAYAFSLLLWRGFSVLVHNLISAHALFGYNDLAVGASFLVYVIPSALFTIYFLPHWLVYKTVLYFNFCLEKQTMNNAQELRDACRPLQSSVFGDNVNVTGTNSNHSSGDNEEEVALVASTSRQIV